MPSPDVKKIKVQCVKTACAQGQRTSPCFEVQDFGVSHKCPVDHRDKNYKVQLETKFLVLTTLIFK